MHWVDRCLNSLRNSTMPVDIFVIDNGSTDGSQKYIKNNFQEVFFTQSETNLGFGKANNIGLQYALDNNYDYVYLLNQDAWVMPDTIEKLINTQRNHPEYGVLSPMQLEANNERFDKIFGLICSGQINNDFLNDLFFNHIKTVYQVKDVMAAHWLISRTCIEKVGGFSPTFPHYGEDNNYNQRIYIKGLKVGIVPDAIAIHDRATREKTRERDMYMFYINWLIKLSNPHLSLKRSGYHILKESCLNSLGFKSFKPIEYGLKIFRNWVNIAKNKEISIRDNCAFLNPS